MSTVIRPAHSTDDPLWMQVLGDLRRRLAVGEFTAGFPADSVLVGQYGVSRHTVRQAVRVLQDEGVLDRQRGRGSFLRPVDLEQQIGPLYSVFRTIEAQGYVQRSAVLALQCCRDAQAAASLGLDEAVDLVLLHRVRFADDTAFAIDRIWMPTEVATPLLGVDFRHTALYTELEQRCGVRPVSGSESIRPALPTVEEAGHLGIDALTPVFSVTRRTDHMSGPLEWRHTVLRGDLFRFSSTWSPGESDGRYAFGVQSGDVTPRKS